MLEPPCHLQDSTLKWCARGIDNKLLRMLPTEIQNAIHMLLIIWATGFTPESLKTSNTILVDKNRGDETEVSSYYRTIGLTNTLYKLWTRLITNKHADAFHTQHHTRQLATAHTNIPSTNSKR